MIQDPSKDKNDVEPFHDRELECLKSSKKDPTDNNLKCLRTS